MSDERKPSEDLKEGLGLIFRAARAAVKQVDVSKIDKGLDKAISQATRVATTVGRAVSEELNRVASTKQPPWQSDKESEAGDGAASPEEGEGRVWASEAQQSGDQGGEGRESEPKPE
jgi:hypothetical protein